MFLLLGQWLTPSNAQAEAQWISTPDLTHIPHWTVPSGKQSRLVKSSSPYADIYASIEDEAVAHELMRHAHTAIPRIAKQLGVSTGGAMQIYLANTQQKFQAMQPHAPPDWADGTAWPKNGWIFLRSPRIRSGLAEPLHQVLDHEIVHILLAVRLHITQFLDGYKKASRKLSPGNTRRARFNSWVHLLNQCHF